MPRMNKLNKRLRNVAGLGGGRKSSSAGAFSAEDVSSAHMVAHEDIETLTQDVRKFSEALAQLKAVVDAADEVTPGQTRVAAHDRLSVVLGVLRSVLQEYPALHSDHVLVSTSTLIARVKGLRGAENGDSAAPCSDVADLNDAIDQVAIAFSSCISEYLMGDSDAVLAAGGAAAAGIPPVSRTMSADNIHSRGLDDSGDSLGDSLDDIDADGGSCQAQDSLLASLEQGVDIAMQRAKLWTRYARDLATYIDKRCQHEVELAKGLVKLSTVTKITLTEEGFLPLQSTYCIALEHDMEHAKNCLATCAALQGEKFVQPVYTLMAEQEKSRKSIKQRFLKGCKKMHEAESNLKKARLLYMQRQQDFERAKEACVKAEEEGSGKLDRRRKHVDDCMIKAAEAETTYKGCVHDANEQARVLRREKVEAVAALRLLMAAGDTRLQHLTTLAFHMLHTLSAPAPIRYQTLCERARLYEPGSQLTEFIKTLPTPDPRPSDRPDFVFESYLTEHRSHHQASGAYRTAVDSMVSPVDMLRQTSYNSAGSDPEDELSHSMSRRRRGEMTRLRPGGQLRLDRSDSESGSVRSLDSSPAGSPGNRRLLDMGQSMDETSGPPRFSTNGRPGGPIQRSPSAHETMSVGARTHAFRYMPVAGGRCGECHKPVLNFSELQCTMCEMWCHRRCLEVMSAKCPEVRADGTGPVFGHGLHHTTTGGLNQLVVRCIHEIERRGLDVKGIYRVSGVKSKVEALCSALDAGHVSEEELQCQHPNLIANVVKLYFRQLPEPLMTYERYDDFVRLAKEDVEAGGRTRGDVVQQMRSLCGVLSPKNRAMLAFVVHHLRRVTENFTANQMNATNLGIVLGPTLLKPVSDGPASFNSLVDTPYQTRAIEILINHYEDVFPQHYEEAEREARDDGKSTPQPEFPEELPEESRDHSPASEPREDTPDSQPREYTPDSQREGSSAGSEDFKDASDVPPNPEISVSHPSESQFDTTAEGSANHATGGASPQQLPVNGGSGLSDHTTSSDVTAASPSSQTPPPSDAATLRSQVSDVATSNDTSRASALYISPAKQASSPKAAESDTVDMPDAQPPPLDPIPSPRRHRRTMSDDKHAPHPPSGVLPDSPGSIKHPVLKPGGMTAASSLVHSESFTGPLPSQGGRVRHRPHSPIRGMDSVSPYKSQPLAVHRDPGAEGRAPEFV